MKKLNGSRGLNFMGFFGKKHRDLPAYWDV